MDERDETIRHLRAELDDWRNASTEWANTATRAADLIEAGEAAQAVSLLRHDARLAKPTT
ncbi:hypothetical protein [Streptomyces rubiginosohelvolus]|uniref:hypothetical protein n=1 Tax=Streptomyces rubiginosohelvolus TaxID=67362 RepID=UPI0033F52C4E